MADVTREQLAKALRSRNFTVTNQHGLELQGGCYRADTLVTSARGELMFADVLAGSLLEEITGQPEPRHDRDALARAVADPGTVATANLARIAAVVSGDQDPELHAMGVIAEALEPMDRDARRRVLAYFAWREDCTLYPDDDDD